MTDQTAGPRVIADRSLRSTWLAPFRAAGIVLAAIGVVAILLNRSQQLGTPATPGPGMWPFVCSVLLVIFGVLVVITDTRTDYENWSIGSMRVALALASLAAFILLFGAAGFIIACAFLVLAWMRFLLREPWWLSVALAVTVPVILYLLFVTVLGVAFPFDPIGQIFPKGIV